MSFLRPSVSRAQFFVPPGTNLPVNTVFNIIVNVMYWLLALIGILAVIAFVIAGILYLISGGSEERVDTAKKALLYAIIGVIVALAGLIALNVALGILGGAPRF